MEERDLLVVIFVDVSEYNIRVCTTDMFDVISRSITTVLFSRTKSTVYRRPVGPIRR